MEENEVEERVRNADLRAPRITPADIDGEIADEQYHRFPNTTVTVCALTLRNGYVVTGTSAAASPENFNEQLGKDIARANAREKIWPLAGFRLRDQLAAAH